MPARISLARNLFQNFVSRSASIKNPYNLTTRNISHFSITKDQDVENYINEVRKYLDKFQGTSFLFPSERKLLSQESQDKFIGFFQKNKLARYLGLMIGSDSEAETEAANNQIYSMFAKIISNNSSIKLLTTSLPDSAHQLKDLMSSIKDSNIVNLGLNGGRKYSEKEFEIVINNIGNKVERLSLWRMADDDNIRLLAQFLSNNPRVKELHLTVDEGKCDEGIKELALALRYNQNLKTLDIFRNGVVPTAVYRAGENIAGYQKPVMSLGHKIFFAGMREIMQVIANNNRTIVNFRANGSIEGDENSNEILSRIFSENKAIEVAPPIKIGERSASELIEPFFGNTTIISNPIEDEYNNRYSQNSIFEAIVQRNMTYRDVVASFAFNILGIKVLQAIRDKILYLNQGENFYEVPRFDDDNIYDFSKLKDDLTTFARQILFDRLSVDTIRAFSEYWHNPRQQAKLNQLKDYNHQSWPSMFGRDKNGKEIKEIKFLIETGEEIKLRCLTNPQELEEEGRSLKHCVGGYASKCLNEGSHIISVVIDGKPSSTIEIRIDEESRTYQVLQHQGERNSMPSKSAKSGLKYFTDKIKIDYEYLKSEKLKKVHNNLFLLILENFGYNPFDERKIQEVMKIFCKEIMPQKTKDLGISDEEFEKLKVNFERLLKVKEIDFVDFIVGNDSKLSLDNSRQIKPELESLRVSTNIYLQDVIDEIFGANVAMINIRKIDFGSRISEIEIEPFGFVKNTKLSQKIFSFLGMDKDLQEKININENGKIIISGLKLKEVREIFGKLKEQKPREFIKNPQMIEGENEVGVNDHLAR